MVLNMSKQPNTFKSKKKSFITYSFKKFNSKTISKISFVQLLNPTKTIFFFFLRVNELQNQGGEIK